MESKKSDEMKIEIKDALTCFICTAKVLDPVMCPKCKRMVCSKCIKKWFDENHDKCPFCQTHSSFDNMISLPFMNHLSDYFIKEIDNKKDKKNDIKEINKIIDEDEDINSNSFNNINNDNKSLSKTQFIPKKFDENENSNINNENNFNQWSNIKRGDICPKHKSEIIEYYCLNCNTKHCSKCLVIMSEDSKIHKDHKIISIEQKNKYNLDEVKEEINNLVNIVDQIKEYKDNLEIDNKIIEKIKEFASKMIDEFKTFYNKKIEDKKTNLDIKSQLIEKQLTKINNIRNSYIESFNNFIERDDENGFKEYVEKLKDFKNINAFKYPNNYNIYFSPNLKFYETDFIDIDINENEDIIGEMNFYVEGLEKPLLLKLNGETFDEILINLQIESDKLGDEKDRYFALLLFKKNTNIINLDLEEKMLINETLVLGKSVVKSGLNTIVDEDNKCHVKLILSIFHI